MQLLPEDAILNQILLPLLTALHWTLSKEVAQPVPYLQHYEPVRYDHHRLKSHLSKRSADGITFQFEAFGRFFTPVLFEDVLHIHPNVVIETSKGRYDRKPTPVHGFVKEDLAKVSGILNKDGHFEGRIVLSDVTYFIVRLSNVFNDSRQDFHHFHTVIYRDKDITFNSTHNMCAHAHLKDRQKTLTRLVHKNPTNDADDVHNTFTNLKLKYSRSFNELITPSRQSRRKREVDPTKTACELFMQADHLYYQRYGSDVDIVIEQLTQHVQAVNDIYKTIDFDGQGGPDNIDFIIKKIKIWDDPTVTNYKYDGNFAVDYLLDLHSQDNYDSFCLSYLFTYRDFSDGVLGLAWVGHPSYAGGVCEKYKTYQGEGKSLNTGIVTVLNYGTEIPSAVSHVTFAHEIGHNFGSEHDPEDNDACAPGGTDGNYIMYARATSGDKPNNLKLSSCSIAQIQPVLEAKARDVDGCFVESRDEICGNRVVEGSEECDCGWADECTEGCCNPQRENASTGGTPCTRKSTSVCSPSEGPCCTSDCQFAESSRLCRSETDCQLEAHCWTEATCPESEHKANATTCGDSGDYMVCYNGECTGSICLAYGREHCLCSSSSGNWKDEKLCQVCCVDAETCKSSYDLPDIPDSKVLAGTPCNNYQGYCDIFKICREVDPEGPLSNLKKLFLSGEALDTIKTFLNNHWYVGLAAGLFLLIVIALVVKFCSKSHHRPDKTTDSPSQIPRETRRALNTRQNQIAPHGYI